MMEAMNDLRDFYRVFSAWNQLEIQELLLTLRYLNRISNFCNIKAPKCFFKAPVRIFKQVMKQKETTSDAFL